MRDSAIARSSLLYRMAALPVVGYLLILCWSKGWLPHPSRSLTARLRDGRLLRCQMIDKTQRTMYLGLFEPSETQLLDQFLGSGDTFVDVGAHIGWFTTLAARKVGGAGQVLAFEPCEPNATLLKENVASNKCGNVRILEMALGSQSGTLSLAASGGDSGGYTAVDWESLRGSGHFEVPVVTLDDAVGGLPNVALMKIDVEGWEPHVLRGASRTLSRTERVLIEINEPALAESGSSAEELFGLLRKAGFSQFEPVMQRGLRRLHRGLNVRNVLATRSEILAPDP